MGEVAKKKEEHLYPVMSPAKFHQAVFPIPPVQFFFPIFKAALHSIFPPCDGCLSVFSDPEEDFQPLTPSGLDPH